MPNDNVLTDKQRAALTSGIAALEKLGWTDPAAVLRALLATPKPEPRAEVTDAEVRALLQLEEAIRHDREMFEGTSDEDNPMGYLVTTALKVLDAARTGASS
ncbi:hypothetical protein [Burkholderia vietnamiensis]|uniref:hypothetical protein n=1 Tax=Burkholderia vietnamiensis TaxID=60552 RepID=UPI00075CE929|nr:hypothetical protein [Burkholderia vietnamiensis]KVR99574.1 hypothetical protein WK29_30075 [Burkholderia vietnamiensis]KVS32712.1 hypothetical protein WK35_07900 [Burkholderia vietnamiensis]MCA7985250.1 hypothetical protein [Burkholderia vietnamiensis]HDR8933009.1 hypothetical protein [Burkholderia vietnamiensis]